MKLNSRLIKPPATVTLSPATFRLCWIAIILFHVLNAFFAALAGLAHLLLARPAIYQNMWMLAIEREPLLLAGWSYVAVALIHIAFVVGHVTQSIRERELSFGFQRRSRITATSGPSVNTVRRRSSLAAAWRSVQQSSTRSGVIEVIYQVRQFVEIVLQTYQADQISRSVSRRDVNCLMVTAVAFNCFHTPIIDAALRHSHHGRGMRLLLLHLIDIGLDFFTTVIIPIIIIIPHFLEFDFATHHFPMTLTFNDVWATSSIGEGRQILVTSTMDYVASLGPLLLGILSMGTVKSMLRRDRRTTQSVTSSSHADGPQVPVATFRRLERTILFFLHTAAFVWGVLTVRIHVQARSGSSHKTKIDGCHLEIHAWHITKSPCAVLHFNCNARGQLDGNSGEIDSVLDLIERSVLRHVVFSHCPRLEIPPLLVTAFPNLNALSTFNCTIANWDTSAALTQTHTKTMSQLQLVDTNMTSLPDGLRHDSLPTSLNLILHVSNLSTLPENIGSIWSCVQWSTLWLEYTQLTSLPASFSRLTMTKLSLEGSPITALADDLFDNKQLSIVRLSRTNITTLPSRIADTSKLSTFLADETRLSAVPTLLLTWLQSPSSITRYATAHGSPVCDDEAVSALVCGEVAESRRNRLPYEVIAAQRPLTEM